MKICKIIWSTNRLEYLIPTLESSSKFINWGNHEVDGIFIDDMPTDRDDDLIRSLAESHGYNHVILHKENKGITYTWEESYSILTNLKKDYDFIWHQEDDLIINAPINIDDLIEYTYYDKECIQVALAYQMNWYWPQEANEVSVNKTPMKRWNDFYTFNSNHFKKGTFDASFSLTKTKPLLDAINMWKENKLPLLKDINLLELNKHVYCEGVIFIVLSAYKAFHKKLNYLVDDWCISFYNKNKENFVEHIGEWTWGIRYCTEEIMSERIKEYEKNPKSLSEGSVYQLKKQIEISKSPNDKINSRTWDKL